jgi:DNA-directed RNA polymerase I, II, and III subunit RPABC5
MIIPIRCFTCGKVLANKWNYYVKKVNELEENGSKKVNLDIKTRDPKVYFKDNMQKTILDHMGLDRMCCRRHMLGHVDLIDKI